MLKFFSRDQKSASQSTKSRQVYRERVSVSNNSSKANNSFSFNWVIVSTFFYLVLQVILGMAAQKFVLPYIVASFTRFFTEGLIIMAGFYLGSFFIGVFSPGRRTVEPALGAMLAVIAAFSVSTFTPQYGGWFRLDGIAAAGTATLLAGMLSAAGAYSGEKLMGNTK